MAIDPEMTVHELIERYPFMKDWLPTYAAEFTKLTNPVLYRTVARVATLETAASMADVPADRFLDDIKSEIARHQIIAEETGGSQPAKQIERDPAESHRRQEALKSIIRRLHDGASTDEVKRDFDGLVAEVDSAEIARMEQALIAEGMPVEEVQRLCDVHVTVFKESLDAADEDDVPAGHPVEHYRRENAVASEIVASIRGAIDALATDAGNESARQRLASDLERLALIEIHYVRKENQLFPVLERHGVEGPTKVMWSIDDDIRGRIKTARALLGGGDIEALLRMLPEVLGMVEDMVYKEEKILLPTALQVITKAEWSEIAAGDAQIGYAWIEGEGAISERAAISAVPASEGPMLLPLPTGALSLEQLDVMFRVLPFDITYVDENDTVRFYSEGMRVFPRSPAAIGRLVRNCHPPKSLHKVEEILAAFKAGEKDVAEFWIEMGGKFINIRYFALRDADGVYKGCLEVVQDATHVRSLEGQRRIVDW